MVRRPRLLLPPHLPPLLPLELELALVLPHGLQPQSISTVTRLPTVVISGRLSGGLRMTLPEAEVSNLTLQCPFRLLTVNSWCVEG